MTRQETIQIIALLAGNYDNIAKKDKTQKQLMINTWQECLGDLDYNIVLQAVKKCMIENSYPPTVHEIRKNTIEFINPSTNKTPIEAWNEAYNAICNSSYMTQDKFNALSPEVQKFFGSIRQVKELGQCSRDEVNTVTKGQFLRQYEIILKRNQENKLIPAKMQKLIGELVNKMQIKEITE